MNRIVFLTTIVLILAVTSPASVGDEPSNGIPPNSFVPDKTVPLPAPNPNYTNTDSGTVLLTGNAYNVIVQNEYNLLHWKEWLIHYDITIVDPQLPYLVDLHIDYCHPVAGTPYYQWDQMGIQNAFWQTYYGKDTSPMPLSWTAAGYPLALPGPPLRVNPQQANLVVDTSPFTYNPEWVSLHFEGINATVQYSFFDWCIPEPATLALLGMGASAMLRRRQ
jgi:hypothetical protein